MHLIRLPPVPKNHNQRVDAEMQKSGAKDSTTKSSKKLKAGADAANDASSDSLTGASSAPLTKEQEEEMSSALIAQLLAQEGGGDEDGYYAEYNNDMNYKHLGKKTGKKNKSIYAEYSDEDDDYYHDNEYRPKKKAKKPKAKPAPPKKKAVTEKPKQKSSASTTETVTIAGATASTDMKVSGTAGEGSTSGSDNVQSSVTANAQAITPESTTLGALETIGSTQPIKADATLSKVDSVKSSTTKSIAPSKGEPAATTTTASSSKDKPAKDAAASPYNSGGYSATEEKLFLEALELYGRDWRKVEEHVKTRDSNSIRSHAQKHFIKLFRDNTPLPAKLIESGSGYTLSGKDLDPFSAAAKPYLSQRHFDDPTLLPVQSGHVFIGPDGLPTAPHQLKQAKPDKKLKEPRPPKEPKAPKEAKAKKPKASKAANKENSMGVDEESEEESESESEDDTPPPETEYTLLGRTDYSKSRLRSARERTSVNYGQLPADLDPLTMVKCEPFCGQPNSGVQGCQPFGITVKSNVLLGMDFHAHLMTSEIIGFLAGEWDSKSRTIHVLAIFPCRSLPMAQNHINVEMDPTSEFEVRQEIEKRNMRVVGWYHSHPTFTPDPSLVDIENQSSYQRLFRDEKLKEEPFVGAIVGPYDHRLPGMSSVINWFYISNSADERGHPKRLLYDLKDDESLSEDESSLWLKLVDEYRESPERINFGERWRQDESATKMQKMLVSLGRRMPWLRAPAVAVGKAETAPSDISAPEDAKSSSAASTFIDDVLMADDGKDNSEAAGRIEVSSEGRMMMEGVELNQPSVADKAIDPETADVAVATLAIERITDQFLLRVEQELGTWEAVCY